MIRKLATFIAEDVFPGWESLPGAVTLPDDPKTDAAPADENENENENIDNPQRNIPASTLQGPPGREENRFARLYREIVRRNAQTVAAWQAYGFMNGVLNTDNTSIFGLSMDYGPFAFMDNFDPSYTPNHDDHYLRYSYKNQPSVIWWNLVRLGEAFGELIGSGERVDEDTFVTKGVTTEEFGETLIARAEQIINRTGEEYKLVFKNEYVRLMGRRLGLLTNQESDFQVLFSELLDTMEALELDFNHFFRRLSGVSVDALETDAQREEAAQLFFHSEGVSAVGQTEESGRKRIAAWLGSWRERVREDWRDKSDEERIQFMKSVNPKVCSTYLTTFKCLY
jgi:serine/tyrosine/threonine adenylyltransferase